MSRLVSLAAVSCWMVVAGCGLGSDPPNPVHADSGVPHADGTDRKLDKPSVDPPPPTVCGESIPIQGTAVPGASVFAQGGLETAGIATDAHPVTGRFCLDIRLKPGVSNLIEVRTQDPVLGISEPASVTVKQSSSCTVDTPPPDQPEPQNVAIGLKARASVAPGQGNEGFLTDGNPATVVEYSGKSLTDAGIWVAVKLPKLTELSKIVVKWRDSQGNGDSYGEKYQVLVSAVGDPGDPSLTNGFWTVAKIYDAGIGGIDTVDLKDTKPQASHVALWLSADGDNWGGTTGIWEYFALAELEIWDNPKKVTQPTTQTSTCQSLGL